MDCIGDNYPWSCEEHTDPGSTGNCYEEEDSARYRTMRLKATLVGVG